MGVVYLVGFVQLLQGAKRLYNRPRDSQVPKSLISEDTLPRLGEALTAGKVAFR